MTIAQRLYAQILASLLALIALAGLGMYQIQRTFDAANFTNINVIPSMIDLETAYRGFSSIRARSWQHSVVTDPAARQENSKKLESSRTKMTDAFARYEKNDVADDKDRALLDATRASIKAFDDANGKALALAEAGKYDEARAMMVANQALQGTVNDAFEAHAEYNAEIGKRSAVHALSILANATRSSIIIAVVATLLIAAIGILLARKIVRSLNEAVLIAQTVAAGDLTSHIEVTSNDETGKLMQALKDMNDNLKTIVGDVRIGIDTISTASTQIAAGNLDLSSRTEEQAASLEETASSMEELTSTVKQNAENSMQANQLAQAASEVALKGGMVVTDVITTMGDINESAGKIAEIISVIDGIAFQTNILALNAAVEAARAGEQGRGFAVVASEVRSLAQRSAGAAKEIKTLINTSMKKVEAGTRLVDQVGTTMNDVVSSVRRVSDIISEITAASQEQSAGIEQINQAVTQMDEVTQQNAALVEEAAAAAASLQEQAASLAQSVQVFRLSEAAAAPAPKRLAAAPVRKALTRSAITRSGKPLLAHPRLTTAGAATGGEWEEF